MKNFDKTITSCETTGSLIPRKVLFDNPNKTFVRLSPNGLYFTYKAPHNGVLNIFLSLFNKLNEATYITNDSARGIGDYLWAYDNEHVIFAKDDKGNENTKLYSYNIITKLTKSLTTEVAVGVKAGLYKISYLIPHEIIIGINNRDPKYFDLYKYNLQNNNSAIILENHAYSTFIIDDNLNIRFASKRINNGNHIYYKFDNNNFIPFVEFDFEDSVNSKLLNLDVQGKTLYMLDSRDRDTTALISLDLDTNTSTLLVSGNKTDLNILTRDPINKTIQVVYENYEKTEYTTLDDKIRPDIEYLLKLAKGELSIISRTIDDKKWIVSYGSDTEPLKYYYYDRESHTASYLFSNREELEKYTLSPMHSIVIPTDDGLNLLCYLTVPHSQITNTDVLQIDHPLPTVLYVHGGPWSRDEWGLNNTHQWLADRGYAVLSVNYRGSAGFGKNFCNAGNLQWGQKMQDDLITAVQWSINNNFTIPEKVAIYGGSYGGYAALTGLTVTPEFFTCAIDVVGPSNLLTLGNSFPAYWVSGKERFKKSMGDWMTTEGAEALTQISPLTHVDKIIKPLLLIQGDNDPRVTKIESDQIYEAMTARNMPVLYIRYSNEGHGLVKASNQNSFRAIMEKFLEKFIGGKLEPLTKGDFDDASLLVNNMEIDNLCLGEFINKIIEDL